MLPNGIYEQIVNSRIHNELAQLDHEKYDIELEKLSADDARRILTIYISYVINQGLHYIRDSYPSTKDHEALLAQINLCNDIIRDIARHAKEADFEDNIILEKGEVLTSLYQKINSARHINATKAVHPETSIVENALFTGSKNEPSMLSELKKEILSSDSIDLLVSFVKWSAIRQLLTIRNTLRIIRKNMTRMRNLDGTDIIPGLRYLSLEIMVRLIGIMFSTW